MLHNARHRPRQNWRNTLLVIPAAVEASARCQTMCTVSQAVPTCARQLTYDAIEGSPELVRDHGQELFLSLHADLQVLNLLQSASCEALLHIREVNHKLVSSQSVNVLKRRQRWLWLMFYFYQHAESAHAMELGCCVCLVGDVCNSRKTSKCVAKSQARFCITCPCAPELPSPMLCAEQWSQSCHTSQTRRTAPAKQLHYVCSSSTQQHNKQVWYTSSSGNTVECMFCIQGSVTFAEKLANMLPSSAL